MAKKFQFNNQQISISKKDGCLWFIPYEIYTILGCCNPEHPRSYMYKKPKMKMVIDLKHVQLILDNHFDDLTEPQQIETAAKLKIFIENLLKS